MNDKKEKKVQCYFEKFFYEGEIVEITDQHVVVYDIKSEQEIMLPVSKTVIKRLPKRVVEE